jgi:hypothetical protein
MLIRPAMLEGAIAYTELLRSQLEQEASLANKPDSASPKMLAKLIIGREATAENFERASKEIVAKAMRQAAEALAKPPTVDSLSALAAQSAEIARQSKMLALPTPANDTYLSFIKDASSLQDDTITR